MALRDYLAEEVGEDWVDGLITRREAMQRLGLLGLSVAAAGSLLAACAAAASPSPASGTASPAASASAPSASASAPSASPASAGASQPRASPGATGTEEIRFPGPRGELMGAFATAATPRGGMLVIHENRGLTDHIRSVAARLAGDGYSALAIDLLSEEGGTAAL